jgi:hypothetical protein
VTPCSLVQICNELAITSVYSLSREVWATSNQKNALQLGGADRFRSGQVAYSPTETMLPGDLRNRTDVELTLCILLVAVAFKQYN